MIENIPFDELTLGQTAEYRKTVTEQDIQLFAAVSGDVNPVHLDEAYAQTTPFKGRIAHGMLTGAVVSAALAMTLPGPGTIYLGQSLQFRKPVKIGDTLTVHLTVEAKQEKRRQVTIDCVVKNQDDVVVAAGTADTMAPAEKLRLEAPTLPDITLG